MLEALNYNVEKVTRKKLLKDCFVDILAVNFNKSERSENISNNRSTFTPWTTLRWLTLTPKKTVDLILHHSMCNCALPTDEK